MSKRRKVVGIIEDDSSMSKSLARVLSAHGFATEIYSSAEAYIREAAGSKATCLVIDIQLGGMTGIELRQRLANSGSQLSVVFMSAVADAAVESSALAAGCLAFLHKPFKARQLIDVIKGAPSS